MNADAQKHLHALVDAHKAALQALREANRSIGLANTAIAEMITTHEVAIDAAMRANRAAIDLLSSLQG